MPIEPDDPEDEWTYCCRCGKFICDEPALHDELCDDCDFELHGPIPCEFED